MTEYLKVEFSAETKDQASDILNALLAARLVTGGQFFNAPARFSWKGAVIDIDYYTVTSFTLAKHKQEIAETIGKLSIEEIPMITFLAMDGNPELLQWITDTVG